MREIKFRAWDKENKRMIPSFAHIGEEGRMYTIHREGIEPDYEVMQFTGLKDKNGKEIYEGDIYRFYSSRFEKEFTKVVEWNSDPTMFDCEGEVIGNIYETPDLSKEEK